MFFDFVKTADVNVDVKNYGGVRSKGMTLFHFVHTSLADALIRIQVP